MALPRIERRFFRDAWELTKPYWSSEEKWSALALLVLIVALNLFQVYLNVWLNEWRGLFFDAMQNYNEPVFFHQLFRFTVFAAIWIATGLLVFYATQFLQLRWRRWLTDRYVKGWLADKAYYRMQIEGGNTDNPDQRIAEDLRLFTGQVINPQIGLLNLAIGLVSSIVTFFSFIAILWTLSGSLNIPLGHFGSITIPGYAAVGAIIYAAIGTWATLKIGRPLVGLTFEQQRYEADFRYSLVRLRENSESIAFYNGENHEEALLKGRFGNIYRNFLSILGRQMRLQTFSGFYGQFAVIIPYVVAIPKYFGKVIQMGGVQQIATAFDQVQTSLSFIVNAYSDIADLQAVMFRLTQFEQRSAEVRGEVSAIEVDSRGPAGLSVQELDLDLPNGSKLRTGININVPTSSSLLVMGPTGAGKSTLLRAISGLWPFGKGHISTSAKRPLFLPQKPYIPLGSLRAAVLYPYKPEGVTDAMLVDALKQVGLPKLATELDAEDNWAQRLSVGEQQRLAFARVLVQKPDMIFLDEGTAALDEASEAELYRLIDRLTPKPTVVSVGHRSTLRQLHDAIYDMKVEVAA